MLLTGRYKSSFWQFEAVMCMYLCTSVLQLAVMWAWPQLYQRWRFKVSLEEWGLAPNSLWVAVVASSASTGGTGVAAC